MPSIFSPDEERCRLCLGCWMWSCISRHQVIPDQASGVGCSHNRKPFILYTRALDYSLGALLAQENDGGKEAALYYLSRMLVGAQHRYSPVEKECLAVMFAVQKLRHYLLSNTVYLMSMVNLLKVLVTKAGSLNARLAKWSILLSQFDIRYVPQKAIKG